MKATEVSIERSTINLDDDEVNPEIFTNEILTPKLKRKSISCGKVSVDLTHTKYQVLKECAADLKWKITDEKNTNVRFIDLFWHDLRIDDSKLSSMKVFQRVNHFPAMEGITTKSSLATLLKKMSDSYPKDFNFYPKTWVAPSQLNRLKGDMIDNKRIAL